MNVRALNPKTEAAPKEIQIDSRFIFNIQGKDFVLYAGLLDLAHQRGLKKLIVTILQSPNQENNFTAICRAVAETCDGEIFTDIGDANPTNTDKMIVHHLIRMASTRAKARSLRDLTNIGITCFEELGDIKDGIAGADDPAPKKTAANGYHSSNGNGNSADQKVPKASIAQLKAIENVSKRLKVKEETLAKIVLDQYGVAVADLSSTQAADLIRFLQKSS